MAPAKASSGKVRTPPGWVRRWCGSNSSKASPKNSDRPRRSAKLVSSGKEVANDKGRPSGTSASGYNDLSQSLRVVLIRLVDLHLEGGARMPGIETNDFEPEIAEFMHQPWRHRSGLDPYAGVIPRMQADQNGDLFWNRGALTPPKSAAGIDDDANGRHLLRNVQSNKMSHRSTSDSRITGQCCPDRGAIGGSRADRDYRMSTQGDEPAGSKSEGRTARPRICQCAANARCRPWRARGSPAPSPRLRRTIWP